MARKDFGEGLSYRSVGIDTDPATTGLAGLLAWVSRTLEFRRGVGEPLLPVGFFASAVRLTDRLSLVVSTDGVGSKVLVAQLADRYDTIGIDCVAVNVNDVICTGAEPIALVDYISVERAREELLAAIGRGLYEGARRARIAVVGGELSQHPDSLTGPRQGYAFDMAGTAIGLLDGREPVTGAAVLPGDVVLGLSSDGIHSNGLTLARRALLRSAGDVDRHLAECGRTVGEELLRPTHIYVAEVMALLDAGIDVKGLAHITGNGLLNLTRLTAHVEYRVSSLPPVPPIFGIIQAEGNVETAEMFRVFNMGVGFCVVVSAQDVDAAVRAVKSVGGAVQPIGDVAKSRTKRVVIEPYRLVGQDGRFTEGPS